MNEWVEGSEAGASTVTVWTPWGEQSVQRADRRALMRRIGARTRRSEDTIAPVSLSETAFGARPV